MREGWSTIRSKPMAGACLGVLAVCVACVGCSSGGGGSADSVFNQQDFDLVMGEIVIPALKLLNPNLAPMVVVRAAAFAPPAPSGTINSPGAEDLSSLYCDSGTACRAPNGNGTTTTFSDCVAQGAAINGTWVVVGTPDDNTATLDLTVTVLPLGTATLQGTVDTSPGQNNCLQEDVQSVTVQAAANSIVIDGLLTYCPAAAWPSGSREVTITGTPGDFLYQMTFDATNQAPVVIKDQSSGNTLETCFTNLDDASSTCDPV